jgi:PIN domain nuclease of toxin-antitoxin system
VTGHGVAFVVDSSALLALLQSETGAELVEETVQDAAISSVNWSEICQKRAAHGVEAGGLRAEVELLGIEIVPFTAEDAEAAAELWASTRRLGLSLGDRACLALAQRLGAPAVTADRSWLDLDPIIGIEVEAIR